MHSVEISPRPSLLIESLRSIGYTLETALADVIDNSVTAEASTISVRFLWAAGAPWIAVIDDGRGMTETELVEAMRFGSASPLAERSPHDLGRFGLGMKTASISQCRKLTVISKSGGVTSSCTWDLDVLAAPETSKWKALMTEPSALLGLPVIGPLVRETLTQRSSGTIVVWEHMDGVLRDPAAGSSEPRFSEAMHRSRKHLETVFHRFLSPDTGKNALRIDFNGSPLVAFDPFGPKHPARQELPLETIFVNGERVDVQPYVLPHHNKLPRADYEAFGGDEGYLQSQGFYVYRNRRLIVKGTWFRLIRKEELNKLIRVRVDIPNSLDNLWKIDVKKSQADPPETVLRELRKLIHKIAGTGRRVYTKRAARLQFRDLVPVWKREIVEGKIRYLLNAEHPLLKEFLNDSDESRNARGRACFRLISASFPSDLYFSDATDDSVEFGPAPSEVETFEVLAKLIEALRKCGFEGEELRRQLLKTESPEISAEQIDMAFAMLRVCASAQIKANAFLD